MKISRSTVTSFKIAAQRIRAAAKQAKAVTGPAYRMIGEEIMTDVKDSKPGHGVPVDKGPLRASGRVEGGSEGRPVSLSFGGAAAPYALIQHEVTKFHHRIGEARYLVRGLERWSPGNSAAWRYLRDHMGKALGGK